MVGCVQIEYVNRPVGAELLERRVGVLLQTVWLVDTRLVGVDFGRESEATVLPLGVPRPCLLLPANVHSGGIDFIVALRLEVVEMLCEFVEVGDAGTRFLVRAWRGV